MRDVHKYMDKHKIIKIGKVNTYILGICEQCGTPFIRYGLSKSWIPITKSDGGLISEAVKLAGPKHTDAIYEYAKSDDYKNDCVQFMGTRATKN